MNTFLEEYLLKENAAKTKQLQKLHETYPEIRFKLLNMWLHGPLMEIDAGFSATYLGSDHNKYTTYIWEPHPNNFMKKRDNTCIVNRFITTETGFY